MIRDKINGYGMLFRFITPVMVAVTGFFTVMFINDIKADIKGVKYDLKEINIGFGNHLEHHRALEIMLGERLRCLEVRLEERLK